MRCIQVVLLLACVAAATANPWKWAGCPLPGSGPAWGHPVSAHKRHTYTAAPDRGIKFAVRAGGKAVTSYCPGKAYTILVTLPELRAFTLTTSTGLLGGSQICGGMRVNVPPTGSGRAPFLTTSYSLTLPKAVPATIVLKVTSARSSSAAYRHNSLTLRRGKC